MRECRICRGTGMVDRPTYWIHRTREIRIGKDWMTEETATEAGGIDACPICAARAEAEYMPTLPEKRCLTATVVYLASTRKNKEISNV